MNRDELFIHTLGDITRRTVPGHDEYGVLGIASLVRKLLLDSQPLADQVNRERRLKTTFRVNVEKPIWEIVGPPIPVFWSIQDALDPDTALPSAQPADVSRDQFLGMRVMLIGERWITVKDVVLHVANVVGAVHAGHPQTDAQGELEDLGERIRIGGYSPDIGSLQAIGRIVVKAFDPLRRAIEANRPS